MLTNLLLEATDGAKTANSWWIYVVLIVLVVVMLVLPSITNKRRMKEYNQMLDQLRVGDEVRTIGGVIGRVTKIGTKGDVKTFTLETGAKNNKTTMEFDMAAVGSVLKSTYVAPEEDKKAGEKTEEVKETENKEVVEVKEETEVKETEVKEEPKAKKTTTKKKTTKK